MSAIFEHAVKRVEHMRALLDIAEGYSAALDAFELSAQERAYHSGKAGPSPTELRDFAEARREIAKLRDHALAELDAGLRALRQARVRRVLDVIPEALDVVDGPMLEILEGMIDLRKAKRAEPIKGIEFRMTVDLKSKDAP